MRDRNFDFTNIKMRLETFQVLKGTELKQIIEIDDEKCQGCTNCIRVCPVRDANIAHISADKLQVRIDPNKCIVCGACIRACPHGARFYNDDTERFIDDIKYGEPIALIVAPAFKENFENWRSILAWLKTKGVSAIVDVSLGIEICTWAHIRYVERYHPTALITQPCPPIVGYIEKRCPQLFSKASPVRSPILCTSIYLKNTLELSETIAALTPCPAKTNEFAEANTVGYNVTFKKLADYIAAHNISIPQADFDFDNIAVASGKELKMPSNLSESLGCISGCISFIGLRKEIDTARSRGNVYRYLDLLSSEEPRAFPVLLDALNCIGGCTFGAGCNIDKPERMADKRHAVEKKHLSEQANLFSVFDHTLILSDYIKRCDCISPVI